MENKKKHRTTFIIKSFLIIAILLFKYKAVTFIKSDKSSKLFTYLKSTFNSFTQSTIDFSSESKIIESTNKSFTQSIIAIIIILFVIINLNISSDLDFNTEVSTYINIFYIFIILTLGIILNYSDYINVNKKKTIALTIFITLCLGVLGIIDYVEVNGKINNWILNNLTNKSNNNNENEDEDLKERSILLLDEGLNYILFFVFLYIFLQTMTYIINFKYKN